MEAHHLAAIASREAIAAVAEALREAAGSCSDSTSIRDALDRVAKALDERE